MISPADTAWMLTSTALVLLMTPALAFFYGGLVGAEERPEHDDDELHRARVRRHAVGGHRLLARVRHRHDWIGDTSRLLPARRWPRGARARIPHLLYMSYQATFAIITAALISGAIVGRMRFSAYVTFISLWAIVVYSPIAHWVWGGGWLAQMGALDFAGGTVVHVNAGTAALVAAIVVGPRRGLSRTSLMLPHNVPFTLLGAGLLWFGWFGFNAGSALAANGIAALAFTTTLLAPAATLVVWTLLDAVRTRKPTAVGAATAIVVGLVAITPAAGYIGPMSAIILGGLAAIPELLRPAVAREDVARRLARRRGGARRRRHGRRAADRRVCAEGAERRRRRPALRQPGAAGHPGDGRGCRDRLQRRR